MKKDNKNSSLSLAYKSFENVLINDILLHLERGFKLKENLSKMDVDESQVPDLKMMMKILNMEPDDTAPRSKPKKPKAKKSSEDEAPRNVKKCVYLFTKGRRTGQQCGAKVTDDVEHSFCKGCRKKSKARDIINGTVPPAEDTPAVPEDIVWDPETVADSSNTISIKKTKEPGVFYNKETMFRVLVIDDDRALATGVFTNLDKMEYRPLTKDEEKIANEMGMDVRKDKPADPGKDEDGDEERGEANEEDDEEEVLESSSDDSDHVSESSDSEDNYADPSIEETLAAYGVEDDEITF